MISVIMSAYNAEKHISNSIESILSQSYQNFEFLIMDDGSTDNTSKIITSYIKTDTRIKLFNNNSNIGLTKSLNFLINQANGEYLARQDSDDVSDSKRFELQLNFMITNNLQASTTRAKIKNTNKKIPGYSYYLPHKVLMKFKNPFIHGTLIIKKSLMQTVGLYDEDYYFAQDYKLFADLLSRKYKIGSLNKCLYTLNVDNNLSNKFKSQQQEYAKIVKKNFKPFGLI